jgi:uncharacterized protein YcgI (DUF1989 family)
VHPIDPTTTRTLVGVGYPTPGLPSKAFDTGFEPLVEVVRDTCGRHDAFGLACTNRYYEDMGYFGHVNCSDNFNTEMRPYDIDERPGWMALNLFFNTGIDDTNAGRSPTLSVCPQPARAISMRQTAGFRLIFTFAPMRQKNFSQRQWLSE